MPAALIKFTQDGAGGVDGQALFGVVDAPLLVENANNNDVLSWQVDVLYSPSGSAIAIGTLASADNNPVASGTFTPDLAGGYRISLSVWSVIDREGAPVDVDIRTFGIKEANGLFVPPPQVWPFPLPPLESGLSGAKPNENNFDGADTGWAGDGTDGLLGEVIKRVDAAAMPVQQHVLSFGGPATPGGAGDHVYCGDFWNVSAASSAVSLGRFRFTALIKPTAMNLGYIIADGATGAHAQLIGVNPISGGQGLAIEGDFRTDDLVGSFDFQSQACDVIKLNQWALIDVCWDGTTFLVYLEGVCIFSKFCTANRIAGALGVDGALFIGGSDHVNFTGLMAFAILWDCDKLALPQGSVFTLANAFRPVNEIVASQGGDIPDFALDMMTPAATVVDRSVGLFGVASSSSAYRGIPQHHGVRRYSLPAGGREGTPRTIPEWVIDTTCPAYMTQYPRVIENALVGEVQIVPTGAKLWDDFSGRHETFYTSEYPKLGSTLATGSLGAQVWQCRGDTVNSVFAWGVLCGFGCYLGEGQTPASPAWVTNDSADMDVRIEVPIGCDAGRRADYFEGPAIAFRVQDIDNGWVFFVEEDRKGQLRRYTAGVATDVGAQVTVAANFTWLRAVTSGTSISIYAGTGAQGSQTWTLATSTTSAVFQSATGAGMASRGGSKSRFKNFAVF